MTWCWPLNSWASLISRLLNWSRALRTPSGKAIYRRCCCSSPDSLKLGFRCIRRLVSFAHSWMYCMLHFKRTRNSRGSFSIITSPWPFFRYCCVSGCESCPNPRHILMLKLYKKNCQRIPLLMNISNLLWVYINKTQFWLCLKVFYEFKGSKMPTVDTSLGETDWYGGCWMASNN